MNKELLVIAKIADKVKKYEKIGEICNTNFLDPAEILDARSVVKNFPNCFFGGHQEAERKILVIGTEDEQEASKFIDVVTIEGPENLSHREVLGSIIGIGINRDFLGDIIIKEKRADVLVIKEISKYIVQNLERVGREKVKVYKNSFEKILVLEDNFKEIKTTVASLRADAIISAATGLSRENSSKLILNQKVKLNYKQLENTSKQIKKGDKLSVRGFGRVELIEVLGETRKDRVRVVLRKS